MSGEECQPFLYKRVFRKEFWDFMFLNFDIDCHGVLWCGKSYQINVHALNTLFKESILEQNIFHHPI